MVGVNVIVLFGLPASGKSTLAHQMKHAFSQGGAFAAIELDNCLLPAVGASFDPALWRSARDDFHSRIRAVLMEMLKTYCRAHDVTSGTSVLVVVDNLHLPSMRKNIRREVLNCCRSKEPLATVPVHYVEILVHAELSTCVARNALREPHLQVPLEVMVKMNEHIQDQIRKHKRSPSFIILNPLIDRRDDVEAVFQLAADESHAVIIHEPTDPSTAHAASKSLPHLVDVALRRAVTKTVTEWKANSAEVSKSRLDHLARLKKAFAPQAARMIQGGEANIDDIEWLFHVWTLKNPYAAV
jgi:tRNA uridine 5-carbamoylmethylation protein Kti12